MHPAARVTPIRVLVQKEKEACLGTHLPFLFSTPFYCGLQTRGDLMAAAIIAIRKQEAENEAVDAIEEKKISLENMRSKIPAKENRAAEFYLSVLVLG
jgi:hypothetical protein